MSTSGRNHLTKTLWYALRVTWPESKPRKPKWYRVPIDEMLRHIREDLAKNVVAIPSSFPKRSTGDGSKMYDPPMLPLTA
jgi:hypothetical protein